MTGGHRRYLIGEAAIGGAINAVLSLAFVLIVFHGSARVPVAALVFDTLPQSFMVTLMSMIVPGLLTRRRLAAGVIEPLPGGARVPGTAAVRAIVAALAVAVLAWLAARLVLPALLGVPPAFGAVLVAKVVYGALLGAAMTSAAVRIALSDAI